MSEAETLSYGGDIEVKEALIKELKTRRAENRHVDFYEKPDTPGWIETAYYEKIVNPIDRDGFLQYGIASPIIELEKCIFKNMLERNTVNAEQEHHMHTWPERFYDAIPVGCDLGNLHLQFLNWVIRDFIDLDLKNCKSVGEHTDVSIAERTACAIKSIADFGQELLSRNNKFSLGMTFKRWRLDGRIDSLVYLNKAHIDAHYWCQCRKGPHEACWRAAMAGIEYLRYLDGWRNYNMNDILRHAVLSRNHFGEFYLSKHGWIDLSDKLIELVQKQEGVVLS